MKIKKVIPFFLLLPLASFSQNMPFSYEGTQSHGGAIIDTFFKISVPNKDLPVYIFQKINTAKDSIDLPTSGVLILGHNYYKDTSRFDYFLLWNVKGKNIQLTPQDGFLITIKEIKSAINDWKAIQYWVFSDCGNSYQTTYNLKKEECMIFRTAKNHGSISAMQRLRLKTKTHDILISDPYPGNYNSTDVFPNAAMEKYFTILSRLFSYLPSVKTN
jgi:hypothetical protein